MIGHTLIKYKKSLVVWGGYYHAEDDDFRYRSPTFLYILPAGLLTGCNDVKWFVLFCTFKIKILFQLFNMIFGKL